MIHGFRKEARMNRDQFWLTDAQFSKIEPHLPTDTRGKERIDDRRVRRCPQFLSSPEFALTVGFALVGMMVVVGRREAIGFGQRRPTPRERFGELGRELWRKLGDDGVRKAA